MKTYRIQIQECDIQALQVALRLVNGERDKGTEVLHGRKVNLHAVAINLSRMIEDWTEADAWSSVLNRRLE